jgi:hypothetical protein
MTRTLYICAGCKEVHYDNDYTIDDGDRIISENRFKDMLKNMRIIEQQLNQPKEEQNEQQ